VAVRVGKGGPETLKAALQTAVDGGLLNANWPPTSETLMPSCEKRASASIVQASSTWR
jgi:hypothetical protein